MLVSIVKKVVGLCSHHAWAVVAIAVLCTGASGYYAAKHFAINTVRLFTSRAPAHEITDRIATAR